MSTQMLNDRTFTQDNVLKVDQRFSPSSGLLFFAGYLVLMMPTFAAIENPAAAAGAGVLYALLMGGWVGAISRVLSSTHVVAWALSIFGVDLVFLSTPTPLGIGIAIAIAVLAALTLFLDFAVIETGVSQGAPKGFEWYCAYGLQSTLVWFNVEIPRVLALLRGAQ